MIKCNKVYQNKHYLRVLFLNTKKPISANVLTTRERLVSTKAQSYSSFVPSVFC